MYTDVLIVRKNDGHFAAKLTDTDGASFWINGGLAHGNHILIAERGVNARLTVDQAQVAKFKADAGNGVENPHHRIVASGHVDGDRYVGFFDRAGVRIGLKPAAEMAESAETAPIADMFDAA